MKVLLRDKEKKQKRYLMDQNKELERCLECSECKKPIHTCYTVATQSGIQRLNMCADCPMLHKKLYGQENIPSQATGNDPRTSLCCGSCGLTRDEVQMGSPLGCALCYELFQDEVFHDIVDIGHMPNKIKEGNQATHLHIGKTPATQQQTWNSGVTLVSLQKELQETLKREDYEQAAWIRDKIQALTKNQSAQDHGTSSEQPQKP